MWKQGISFICQCFPFAFLCSLLPKEIFFHLIRKKSEDIYLLTDLICGVMPKVLCESWEGVWSEKKISYCSFQALNVNGYCFFLVAFSIISVVEFHSFYFYANFKKKLSHLPHHTMHPQLCTSLYLHLTLEIMLVLFFTGVSKTKYGKIKANSSEESCEICMFWRKGLVTVQNGYGTFNNGLKMVKTQSKFWFCVLWYLWLS